jgi:hypothetical protein
LSTERMINKVSVLGVDAYLEPDGVFLYLPNIGQAVNISEAAAINLAEAIIDFYRRVDDEIGIVKSDSL